jgi:hypothetical protein
MQSELSVRQILREAIEVTKEAPEGLQLIAFPKIFDFLAGSQTQAVQAPGFHSRPRRQDGVALGNTERRSRSGIGPKQATIQVLEAGFFDQPKTIEAIAQHLRQDLVLTFTSKLLATTLGRLVREGLLRRKQNSEGKYEYQKI